VNILSYPTVPSGDDSGVVGILHDANGLELLPFCIESTGIVSSKNTNVEIWILEDEVLLIAHVVDRAVLKCVF
jgi:hypothetical protein